MLSYDINAGAILKPSYLVNQQKLEKVVFFPVKSMPAIGYHCSNFLN